ncbi:MAG: DUF1648 domain-containing protein [Brevundimonas sp.]|uniref:SdpI family protein n=1 Tax=Brevundimonas sp. TaxID=1871086 RepID=UPI00120F44F4|nr:SdpI family protein [Brevundimonas sp.]RZJ18771.1 MAG: DUF1648 domain-containing protein [Brevundimonas sp.]
MTERHDPTAADALSSAVSVALIAGGVWIALAGPTGEVPVHFGIDGQADRWASRYELAALIGGLGLLNGVIGTFTSLARRRSDDPARRRSLGVNQVVTAVAMGGVGAFGAATSLGAVDSLGGAAPMAGLALLFLAIGAFLGRVGANPVVGVRTPWSYKSRLAWERSNRLAGRCFFWLGLAGLIASPVAPQPLGLQLLIGGVLLSALWAVVESWRVWRTDPERQPF